MVRGIRFNNSNSNAFPQFVLKERKNGLELNRFGIVVSKRIDKRAVVRNRIKRIFRTMLEDLSKNMMSGHDILFIVKAGILGKTQKENQELIKQAIEKLGIIKK